MTSSEYQQLAEFLGRQFAAAEQRLAAIDRQFTEVRRDIGEVREGLRYSSLEARFRFNRRYAQAELIALECRMIRNALWRMERDELARCVDGLEQEVRQLQTRIEALELAGQRPRA